MQLAARIALDVVGLTGIASTLYGVSLIYPPAAYILGGVAVTGVTLLLSRRVG